MLSGQHPVIDHSKGILRGEKKESWICWLAVIPLCLSNGLYKTNDFFCRQKSKKDNGKKRGVHPEW